jgi:hypothetical protein
MRQVALALRPGGHLVMVEIHPAYQMIDSRDPDLVVDFPYGGGTGVSFTGTGTYADPTLTMESTTTSYAHSIAETVMGALRAGLVTELLEEHTASEINPRGDDLLTRGEDGLYRLLVGRGTNAGDPPYPMPVFLTYIARKA